MKFVGTLLLSSILLAAIATSPSRAYTYNQLFAGLGPYARQPWLSQPLRPSSGLSGLSGVSGLSGFSGPSGVSSLSGMRDPRSNTGPIQFPPGPPGNPADTSGVIVGASGYGFVPPNSEFWAYFY